jgi:hypothetical protein
VDVVVAAGPENHSSVRLVTARPRAAGHQGCVANTSPGTSAAAHDEEDLRMVTPESDQTGSAPTRPLPARRPARSERRCRDAMVWRAPGIVLITAVREPPTPAASGRGGTDEDERER